METMATHITLYSSQSPCGQISHERFMVLFYAKDGAVNLNSAELMIPALRRRNDSPAVYYILHRTHHHIGSRRWSVRLFLWLLTLLKYVKLNPFHDNLITKTNSCCRTLHNELESMERHKIIVGRFRLIYPWCNPFSWDSVSYCCEVKTWNNNGWTMRERLQNPDHTPICKSSPERKKVGQLELLFTE